MAKLPPDLDLDAVWIEEAMHRGDRARALEMLEEAIASGKAGKETIEIAEYLRTAKRGRQPFGAKHLWPDIGADNDEMRDAGMSHADRMDRLKAKYRVYDESKLRTWCAKYDLAMDEIRAIDWENR